MKFSKPLKHRLHHAANMRERYQSDSEFRLTEINRKRSYMGLPALGSLADVKPRGKWDRKRHA